jgi:hypothetical protein
MVGGGRVKWGKGRKWQKECIPMSVNVKTIK